MAGKSSGGGASAGYGAPAAGGSGVIIGGQMNFGGGGGSMFSGGAEGLAASYNASYNSALAANQQQYNNILTGYQQLAGQQLGNQQAITSGYNTLTNQVLTGIEGSANAQRQMIDRQYAQQAAQASQQMTNSGLNNTTVTQSLQRGITFDQQLAQTNLANQFAQLEASYRSTLGLAGLDYQNQANQQQMNLGVQQLNFMNSVEMPYPDAGAYSNLAMMYGSQEQADKDRAAMEAYGQQAIGASQQGAGGGFAGVMGRPAGGYMPSYGGGGYAAPALQGSGGGGYGATGWNGRYGTESNFYQPGAGGGGMAADSYNAGLGALGGGYMGYAPYSGIQAGGDYGGGGSF